MTVAVVVPNVASAISMYSTDSSAVPFGSLAFVPPRLYMVILVESPWTLLRLSFSLLNDLCEN
jgi:hypothetical protein